MALWDDSPSDGVFRYYWADHEEFEFAYGPFDTAEEALAAALKQAEEESFGPEPGSTIYVARADKRTTVPPTFDTEALMDEFKRTGGMSFDSEQVLELFMEANEDCWGEDGWDGLTGDSEAASEDLIKKLLYAATNWMLAKPADDVAAEEMLQQDLQAAMRAWEMEHRAQIKVWMFGQLETAAEFTVPDLTPHELKERNIRHFQRVTGLPRTEIEAAMRGERPASLTEPPA